MSIPINTDNSVQLSYSSFPFTITDIDNYATSNYVISNSNILNTKINTKQDLLTSSTSLLGDGSAITNLDYNKILLNKPTYFQTDWNSTITNKPSIYTQSEINSLLSQKEAVLTFNSPLTRSTNTIGINLNSYTPFSSLLSSNYATYSGLLSCNYITNSTSGLTNYILKGGDIMNGDLTISKTNARLSLKGGGGGGAISRLDLSPYDYTTKEPACSFITTDNANYSASLNIKIKSSGNAGNNGQYSALFIKPEGNVGINSDAPNYKLDINGSLNSTSLYQNGTLIDFSSYATNISIYTKTETNNLLSQKQANLTFSSPLVNNANTITFNESSITTLTNFYNKSSIDTFLGNKQANLTFSSPLVNTANTITFNESSITTLTNFYNKSSIDTFLNNKQANLTFSSPLVNTANTITFNESSITTLTNFYNKTQTDTFNLNLQDLNIYDTNIRQYPPKLYDTSTTETTNTGELTNIVPTTYYKGSFQINPYANGYGIGTYIVYTSSFYANGTERKLLFDYNLTDGGAHWNDASYSQGNYLGSSYIQDINYKGDWIILKLPYAIILNRFRFYNRTGGGSEGRSPGLWKCWGSMDGLSFVEITEASNTTTKAVYTSNYYEKTLTTFSTPYRYIGFTINKLVGSSLASDYILNFSEIQLFAKPFYVNSNVFVSTLNKYSTTGTDTNYLLKTGGVMTGDLTISKTGARLSLKGTGAGAVTRLDLSAYDNTTFEPSCSFIITDDTNYSSSFDIKIKTPGANANSQTSALFIKSNKNIGIGTTNPQYLLDIYSDSTSVNNHIRIRADVAREAGIILARTGNNWEIFNKGNGYSGTANNLSFQSSSTTSVLELSQSGVIYIKNELRNQYWKLTNQSDYCRLYDSAGTDYFNFAARDLYASRDLFVLQNSSLSGRLTLNDVAITGSDYSRNRIWFANNSTCYYQGYGSYDGATTHEFRNNNGSPQMIIYNGGNQGIRVYGQITCVLYTTTSYSPHDYAGVPYETNSGANGTYTLQLILNSFTGFHRNFTEDELFDENDPQLFKDTYEGRIVVSTGKIATQIGNEKNGFDIKYDKEGIFIEDTHPLIELSRTKKDKRVFGVLGRKDRKNSNEKRLIINSVGEGAIWVCNSNGNIENGDYITSSDYLGYGEKQDEIFLCNYTCAKATMDCSFELDSPYYNCFEIDDLDTNGNKLKVAFIASTYHSG